jgi:hypothetical protein
MLTHRQKSLRSGLCLAVLSMLSGACFMPHPEQGKPDDHEGRGCPIPHGDETLGPLGGQFLEMYAAHVVPSGHVIVSVRPHGREFFVKAGKTSTKITPDHWYKFDLEIGDNGPILNLTNEQANTTVTFDGIAVRPAKGDIKEKLAYELPGMTIRSATGQGFSFSLRVGGKSVPIEIFV